MNKGTSERKAPRIAEKKKTQGSRRRDKKADNDAIPDHSCLVISTARRKGHEWKEVRRSASRDAKGRAGGTLIEAF